MANVCKFKIIVKGRANACAAFYTSTPSFGLTIVEEHGTEDDHYLRFEGSCKWSIDYGVQRWNGAVPVVLPENIREAGEKAMRNYSDYYMQDRSRMFQVEVLCNSADLDDYDGSRFIHYKNGIPIFDRAPEELGISAGYIFDEGQEEDYGEPHEPDRIKAYYEADEEYGNWFQIKYHNPLLKDILEKYHYVSEAIENLCEFDMDEKIENYAGVNTIDALTSTLLGMYIHLGTADNGFAGEVNRRKQEIIRAFSFIEGNSQEGFFFHEEYEENVFDGFDFELKNGVYTSKYRYGVGW